MITFLLFLKRTLLNRIRADDIRIFDPGISCRSARILKCKMASPNDTQEKTYYNLSYSFGLFTYS